MEGKICPLLGQSKLSIGRDIQRDVFFVLERNRELCSFPSVERGIDRVFPFSRMAVEGVEKKAGNKCCRGLVFRHGGSPNRHRQLWIQLELVKDNQGRWSKFPNVN